ncbi:MAG: DUF1415 domain-containing protein [Bacteroidetes bacterium]|nr:DUF1415 domain-containing protein [Bacteroidota bacterium]
MKDTYRSEIDETIHWINKVVIGCNFCPFAAREMLNDRVRLRGVPPLGMEKELEALTEEIFLLDKDPEIETTLILYPESMPSFSEFLDFLAIGEQLLVDMGYEGIYQLASFHPLYVFDGQSPEDPANYTNRSPYPMLHLLREESLEKAIKDYPNPEQIPVRNMEFARNRGLTYMLHLLNS